MPTKTVPPFPDLEAVAEETSAREVNAMLRAGWRLLAVIAAHDGCGGYPVYVVGRPRARMARWGVLSASKLRQQGWARFAV